MNIDLYLNLKSVLNIYDEYQTKFKECEEKLSEKKVKMINIIMIILI